MRSFRIGHLHRTTVSKPRSPAALVHQSGRRTGEVRHELYVGDRSSSTAGQALRDAEGGMLRRAVIERLPVGAHVNSVGVSCQQ